MENKFDLEHQYQIFLQRMSLNEDTMHPLQKSQLKQAFFGACGQMLILFRDDVVTLYDDHSYDVVRGMIDQVGEFFVNEVKNHRDESS